MRVTTQVLGVFVLAGATLFVAPGTASALPIVGGCTTPPAPESPQQGIAGFFMSKPNPVPPTEDPFAANAKTTPFEQYGLAGLSWYTYDLGCGGAARDPSGSISTWAARLMFIPAKATVAALTGVMQAALHPTYLSAFDPLLNSLVSQLRRAVYTPLFPLAVMLTGLLLMAQATRQRVSESTTAIGWCLLVTVVAAALFAWPVKAGHAADTVISKGVGAVSAGITGQGGDPGDQVANMLYGPFLYRMWLMGEFCDPDSTGAQKHGSALLQAQALSWQEAEQAKTNGEKITDAKQKTFGDVAGQVKNDDPSAYECVAGHGSASLEASILADVGVLLMAPFLLIGGLILIAAYLVVRFAVIFAPALLTAGAFFPLRGIVLAAGRVVAAAIINGILFTLAVLLVIRVDSAILDPSTALPAWLRLVLVGVVTVVMWYLTRPFRKLTTMVTTGRLAWAMGDRSYYERGGLFGRRRGFDAAIVEDDGHATVVAREEAPRPGRHAAAGGGRPGRGGGADLGALDPAGRRREHGRRGRGGGRGRCGRGRFRRRFARPAARRRRRSAGPAAPRSGPAGADARIPAGDPAGRGSSGARAPGGRDRRRAPPRAGDSVPVHSPPPSPRRRPVPEPGAGRPTGGSTRACSTRAPRPAGPRGRRPRLPEPGPRRGRRRRALPPVRPGPALPAVPATGAAARDQAAAAGVLGGPLGHQDAAAGDRRARRPGARRGRARGRADAGPPGQHPVRTGRRPDQRRAGADRPAVHPAAGPDRSRSRRSRRVPSFRLSPAQEAPAVGYVVAANSHDARPGRDKAFTDSYRRARPYVTADLFREIMAVDPRRGDYQWRQWLAGKATVEVTVLATGVPDGAPAPTATTAYTRVQFRQTVRPTAGAQAPTSSVDVLNMLVTRGSDGRWLVSRLLADV